MHFDFSFEQRMLADSVGKTLRALPPVTDRPPYPFPPEEGIARLAELGLFGDEGEAAALSWSDAVALAIEAGRTITATPLIEALAVSLVFSGDPVTARLRRGELAGVAVSGCLAGKDGYLSGDVVVTHGEAAGFIVAPYDTGSGRVWAAFDSRDAAIEPMDVLDIAAGAARVSFDRIAVPVQTASRPGREMDRALQLLAIAEVVGAAEECLRKTVTYVGERKQFGKPVGSNQAVKHMAADCAMAVETMKAAVEYAGWALDASASDEAMAKEAELALLSAASFVGEHGRRVAERCVQMHGGIAFTWDYGLHVPLRRIVFRTATLIAVRAGREALATHLLD